jgi:hypothetical protein
MKSINKKIMLPFLISIIGCTIACKKSFLDAKPEGVYNEIDLLSKKGVDGLLINAYTSLGGNQSAGLGGIGMSVGPSNWLFGSIAGGEAYKGGLSATDQSEANAIMQWATPATNPEISTKWNSLYDGVGRANNVLKVLASVSDPSLTDAMRNQITAEARFIRAFQHFELKKIFNNVPFVDENVTDFKISNTDAAGNYVDIWPQIEADLQFAYDNLPQTSTNVGRVNKWAAAAFLAKAYLFQKKYVEAKSLFDMIIAQGTNSLGVKYDLLDNFGANFRVATQNGKESVFEVQSSFGDGSTTSGNHDYLLTYPNGIAGGTNSWFFRPSQNIVNSFRTTEQGLPMPDAYNDVDVTPFESVPDAGPFTPYQGPLDPRLDHTVGRRGIPYLDWGLMTGVAFTAPPGDPIQNGGAYCGKKQVFSKAEFNGGLAGKVNWYVSSALNYVIMRYADVLLMAAECEIEAGSMETTRTYINKVRARAAASSQKDLSGISNAANYKVGLYEVPFASQDEARKAVRFERKLELAEEGHRFFDLVRWGIAEQEINNNYLPKESIRRSSLFQGVRFIKGKSEYQPIPTYAVTQSAVAGQPTLKQNPGY